MVALTDLTDVTLTAPAPGDILYTADGATWVNIAPGAGIGIQPYDAATSKTNVAETRSANINMAGNLFIRPLLRNYAELVVTVAAATTTTLDLSAGNAFVITQDTNIATLVFDNVPAAGQCVGMTIIRVKDNSAVSYAITWPASLKWKDGTSPTLTQDANAIDTFELFTTDGGTSWYGFQSGLNML